MSTSETGQTTFEEQVVVDTLPPAVWNIVRDLESWPEWNPVCPEAKWKGGPSWGEGSTARFQLKLGDESAVLDARLTEVDLPWLIVWTAERDGITESHRFELEWEGPRSIVHYTLTVAGPGEGAAPPSLEAPWRAMARAWLRALKAIVEEKGNQFWELTYAGDAARRGPQGQ